MMIPTLTANPHEFGRALRRMREKQIVRERRRAFWRGVRIGLRRIFRPRPGVPD